MPQSLLALVEISFANEDDFKKGTDLVQSNLRECKTASAFAVYEDKIGFHMWFDGQADYSLLNQIKKELAANGLQNFSLNIREFTETKTFKI